MFLYFLIIVPFSLFVAPFFKKKKKNQSCWRKNRCTYLELGRSINDALRGDETNYSNKVQQRDVKRSKQKDRQTDGRKNIFMY